MTDILCPTDFTPAAEKAMQFALRIAAREGSSITLLHVLDKHHEQSDALSAASSLMGHSAEKAMTEVKVNEIFREGDPLKQIIAESQKGHSLMVVGTHGPKGLRQSLLGADILKLVRHVTVPSLVVQAGSHPEATIDRILLPVAGHSNIDQLLDAVCHLAKAFSSEVHVFQVMKPGDQPSDNLLDNKNKMLHRLADEKIKCVEANVPSTVFSLGFSQQTINYAKDINAGCIAIMAKASEEYRYIADAEKERMLMNDAFIPVLCAV